MKVRPITTVRTVIENIEPGGQGLRLDLVVGQQGLEDHPTQASGGGDESGGMALEQLPVQPGLVVVALQVGG